METIKLTTSEITKNTKPQIKNHPSSAHQICDWNNQIGQVQRLLIEKVIIKKQPIENRTNLASILYFKQKQSLKH